MKRLIFILLLLPILGALADDPVGSAVQTYFDSLFARLKTVAEQQPSEKTFRPLMQPVAESFDGFFGATLTDADYTIRQTYFKKHFLAKGFNLRRVEQLIPFLEQMDRHPAPQLSEPARGTLMQPRLISMRYPVVTDGTLRGVVSIMVRTETFIAVTGLEKCPAFQIICRGVLAERKGTLSENPREITLQLPSTEWIIRYDPPAGAFQSSEPRDEIDIPARSP